MRIFQLLNNSKNYHINRYVSELEIAVNKFTDYLIFTYLLSGSNEDKYPLIHMNKNSIDFMNTCDYIFIHSLPNQQSKELYDILYSLNSKIILFIHYNTIKELYNNVDIDYFKSILSLSYKVVIYKNDIIYNELLKYINIDKIIKLDLIYNSLPLNFEHKTNQIGMISNRGLKTNYSLFLKMFEMFKNDINCDWFLYGLVKNIQTMSIPNLYYDEFGNPSKITNTNINYIDKNKINIYPNIDYDQILDQIMFVVDFDSFDYLTYTMIDVLSGKSILIIDINQAKRIKINSKQSLYDLNCAIYFDENNIDHYKILINKYFISKNSYISLCNKNQKIINQIFYPQKYIEALFNKII